MNRKHALLFSLPLRSLLPPASAAIRSGRLENREFTVNERSDYRNNDLVSSRWNLLLWRVPMVLLLIGALSDEIARTVLWTLGFTVSGVACLVNARRCGRRHCFYTGPLYLSAAAASLFYGLHALPLGRNGWNWILGVAVACTLVAQLGLERLLGKYIERHNVR
jgi:hypothetical protein